MTHIRLSWLYNFNNQIEYVRPSWLNNFNNQWNTFTWVYLVLSFEHNFKILCESILLHELIKEQAKYGTLSFGWQKGDARRAQAKLTPFCQLSDDMEIFKWNALGLPGSKIWLQWNTLGLLGSIIQMIKLNTEAYVVLWFKNTLQ